jgi:uncharacterized protein
MAKPAVMQFEITGRDRATLKSFYGTLFGWQAQEVGVTPGYGVVRTEKGIPGGIGPSWDGGSGHATFYVEVDDLQECLTLAEELRGKLVTPPREIPQFGITFAFFADPEGHIVGLQHGFRG